jgi:general secretion pathway protein G
VVSARCAPARTARAPRAGGRGFTLIELLVVLAVIATLLMLAVPRYFAGLERSKEAVLRQNLQELRESLDKFHGDKGTYPGTLEDLVSQRYLRRIPVDPITESAQTWVVVPPPPDVAVKGTVWDVRSGAPGVAIDGTAYQTW